MDKMTIKKYLLETFIAEDKTPGISQQEKVKKESGKINKSAVKEIEKGSEIDKGAKEDKDASKMPVNKFNYTNDDEKKYHDEMETINGLEMTTFNSDTGEGFRDRAKMALEGDSTMGNAQGGNTEPVWGASDPQFGKKLADRANDSKKKRDAAEIATYGLGDDIESLPKDHKIQKASNATGGTKLAGDKTKSNKSQTDKKQTNEGMKKLTFKKEFNGVGNALKLIPESYRTNNKEFVMTDGNESYKIRWEGNLSEGRAVVLTAENKSMVNEDMNRMRALFNYKSQDTLGLVKGNSRIDENTAFANIWSKTKKLLSESEEEAELMEDAETVVEGENIEGQKAKKEGPWEEAGTPVGPEVPAVHKTKLQTKDGTAPAASVKNADDAVSVAPEVPAVHKKKLQSGNDGTAPAPKQGPWEKISETEDEEEVIEEGENIESAKPSKTAQFDKAGTPVAPEVPAIHKKKLQDKDGTAPKPKAAGDLDKVISVAPEVPAVHKTKLQTKDGTAPAAKADDQKKSGITVAPEATKHITMGGGKKKA